METAASRLLGSLNKMNSAGGNGMIMQSSGFGTKNSELSDGSVEAFQMPRAFSVWCIESQYDDASQWTLFSFGNISCMFTSKRIFLV